MASINEQISHLGNSPILCVLCILRGKIPFFYKNQLTLRLSRFTLSLRTLRRGKINLIYRCARCGTVKSVYFAAAHAA